MEIGKRQIYTCADPEKNSPGGGEVFDGYISLLAGRSGAYVIFCSFYNII